MDLVASKDAKASRVIHPNRSQIGTVTICTFVDLKQRNTIGNCSISAIEKEIDKAPVTAKVFKLGMRHETFINQYSSNPLASEKKQATEEIDKQRYFSLKFSSTGCSGFQ